MHISHFFTLSTIDGYSGCIRFGAIVNKAAVHISCICLLVDVSSHSIEMMPKSEIARSWDWFTLVDAASYQSDNIRVQTY